MREGPSWRVVLLTHIPWGPHPLFSYAVQGSQISREGSLSFYLTVIGFLDWMVSWRHHGSHLCGTYASYSYLQGELGIGSPVQPVVQLPEADCQLGWVWVPHCALVVAAAVAISERGSSEPVFPRYSVLKRPLRAVNKNNLTPSYLSVGYLMIDLGIPQ